MNCTWDIALLVQSRKEGDRPVIANSETAAILEFLKGLF